jgi:hypothetical protein
MRTRSERSYLRRAATTGLILFLGIAWSSVAHAETYTGRAYAAFINVPLFGAGPAYFSDTGSLSPSGGWEGAALYGVQVPNVLSAATLVAATSGAQYVEGAQANSSTSLASVSVLPGHAAAVTASFVRAQTEVTEGGLQGSTEIDKLTFGGVPVAVTGLPNQRVDILGVGTLIINEQKTKSEGTVHEIVVNALHVTLVSGAEVIVSSARSSIGQ